MDELRKITTELAKIDEGKVKAIAEGDRIYLMIQDAPAELRKLADALERIDVREIRALVAYAKPGSAKKASVRSPKAIETSLGTGKTTLDRVEEVVGRFRGPVKKLGGSLEVVSVQPGKTQVRLSGQGPGFSGLRDEVRETLEREVPDLKRVEVLTE